MLGKAGSQQLRLPERRVGLESISNWLEHRVALTHGREGKGVKM